MTDDKTCLRCGQGGQVPAHVERPIPFCLDHAAHHGVLSLGLKAALCPHCGHVELWLSDPAQILGIDRGDKSVVLQEEDF